MFTDIVGYTTMMNKDENEAFKCLEQNRVLHKSIIQEFDGEWLKEMGDGVLVSFTAVSNAVFCAKKILETSHREFDFSLRIGIHLGEVVFENGDIFGDGVNIASRIQSIAPEGCIYISESVLRNVQNKKEIGTKYIGQKTLKHVKHPVKIYQIKIEGKPYQEVEIDSIDHNVAQTKSKTLWMGLLILLVGFIAFGIYQTIPLEESKGKLFFEKPKIKEKSIAVLAFEDLSEDQSQKFYGMGLAVEVINILDEVEGLKVIGKTSAFSFLNKNITIDSIAALLEVNYVLEGTISESDSGKEVIAILTDGLTGQTLSSQSYKMSDNDSSNIRSVIAKQVAYELKMKVNENVILSSNQNDSRLMALEQRAYYGESKRASREEIRAIWDECLSIDSTYIPCIANRSRTSENAEEHLSYVNRLMELDSTNAYTFFVKGNYFFEEHFDLQNAYLNYKKMLEKKPSDIRVLSEAAFRMGHFDIDKGLKYLHIAMNKDPLYYKNYIHLGHLYLLKGDYKKSIDLLHEMKTFTDRSIPWEIIIVNIYGGYYDEAEITLNEFISNYKGTESRQGVENVTLVTAFFMSAAKKESLEFEKNLEKVIAMELSPFPIASALALYGDHDRSFEWLEMGYETKRIKYFEELKYAPWFQDMRSDPRWLVLMQKMGMPGYENHKIIP